MKTYMTATQLALRLPYSRRHISEYLKDRVFIEGVHYVRLPGARKVFYIWERIADELHSARDAGGEIPMANGGVCHG